MNELLKILIADEKKVDILILRYNELKKNIENETKADAETRTHLGMLIAAMKKSNAVIVNHCLGEDKLSLAEIDEILNTHLVEQP